MKSTGKGTKRIMAGALSLLMLLTMLPAGALYSWPEETEISDDSETADAGSIPMTDFSIEVQKGVPFTNICFNIAGSGAPGEEETLNTGEFTGDEDFLRKELHVKVGAFLEVKDFEWTEEEIGEDDQMIGEVTFVRVLDVTDPDNPVEIRRGEAGTNWILRPEDGSVYRFETAVLKTSEIGFREEKEESVLSESGMISESLYVDEYVYNDWGEEDRGYEFRVRVTQKDKPVKMVASRVCAYFPDGKEARLDTYESQSGFRDPIYAISYQTLTDAAFSEAGEDDMKLNILATLAGDGYEDRELFLNNEGNEKAALFVMSGTKEYEAGETDDEGNPVLYRIPYGTALTLKAVPKPGVVLAAGYLIPVTDENKNDMVEEYYYLSDNTIRTRYLESAERFEVSEDGTVTIRIDSYEGEKCLYIEEDTEAAETVPVVMKAIRTVKKKKTGEIVTYRPGERVESAGLREISGNPEAGKAPYYGIVPNNYYFVEYRKGTKRLPIIGDPSATIPDAGSEGALTDVSDAIRQGELPEEDRSSRILIHPASSEAALGGTTVTLKCSVSPGEGEEDAEENTLFFDVKPSYGEDAIAFSPEDLEGGKPVVYFGAEKTFRLSLSGISDKDYEVRFYGQGEGIKSGEPIQFSVDDVRLQRSAEKNEEGEEVTLLTVAVDRDFFDDERREKENSKLYRNISYHLGFYDKESNEEIMEKEVGIAPALPVFPEDYEWEEAISAGFNTITVDLSAASYPFENAEGLFFRIEAKASAQKVNVLNDDEEDETEVDPSPLLAGVTEVIKAPAGKVVLRLSDSSNAFRTTKLSYRVKIRAGIARSGYEETYRITSDPSAFEVSGKGGGASGKELLAGKYAEIRLKDEEVLAEEEAMLAQQTFATKLSLTKTSAGKKKIYTGMEPFTFVNVGYRADKNKTATFKKLEKAELKSQKSGEVVASTKTGSALRILTNEDVDQAIELDPSGIPAGKYDLIVYAMQPMGMIVSSKTSVTILQGIEGIKVTTPSNTVYKKPKKAASLKAKISYEPEKPVSKKVKWYLVKPDYDPEGGAPRTEDLFTGLNSRQISIKNGQVTVRKDVVIEKDLEFAIAAVPADYKHGPSNPAIGRSETIRITTESPQPSHIYLIPFASMNSGNRMFTELRSGADYPVGMFDPVLLLRKDPFEEDTDSEDAEMFFAGPELQEKLKRGYCLIVTDKNGDILSDVTLKASGMTFKDGMLSCSAPKKDVILTAVTTDGSGKSLSLKFNAVSGTNPKFSLFSGKPGQAPWEMTALTQSGMTAGLDTVTGLTVKDLKAENDSDGSLYFVAATRDGNTVSHSLKVTGGKILNKKTAATGKGAVYEIGPTAKDTVISYTDKTTGKQTKLTVENLLYSKSGTKVKVKGDKGKIFRKLAFEDEADYENGGRPNRVTYTVLKGKKPFAEGTMVRILISKDAGNLKEILKKNTEQYGNLRCDAKGNLIAVLDQKGCFTIDYRLGWDLDLPAGKYALTLIPVDENGRALTKSVTVNIKPVDPPKAKIRLNTTALGKFGTAAALEFANSENVIRKDGKPVVSIAANMQLLGVNTKGKISNFGNCFVVDLSDEDVPVLKLKRALTATDGYTGKPGKKSITGYLPVTGRLLNGEYATQYLKVTVKGVTESE
ncbi:MAG: hypothetical protein K6F53_09805 [Lachnospiraceae bacterium]|nr:hypothetical protein [Lachnospiraceae bacterium]